MTNVFVLQDDGSIVQCGGYTLPPREAVVAAERQHNGDWNTWDYPSPEDAGVRAANVRPDVAVLDAGSNHFYAFPEGL